VDRASNYEVAITYACIEGWAGRRFEVRVDSFALLSASVVTGKTWRDYQTFPLGQAKLKAGEHALTVRPLDVKNWKPMSLKFVRLSPAPSA
jgi:hypothetical protein